MAYPAANSWLRHCPSPSEGGPSSIRQYSKAGISLNPLSVVTISRPVRGRFAAWAEPAGPVCRIRSSPRVPSLSPPHRRRYAKCRGLRRALCRRRALTRYSHPFSSLPVMRNRAPSNLFGYLIDRCLPTCNFSQKLSGVHVYGAFSRTSRRPARKTNPVVLAPITKLFIGQKLCQ